MPLACFPHDWTEPYLSSDKVSWIRHCLSCKEVVRVINPEWIRAEEDRLLNGDRISRPRGILSKKNISSK